MTVDDRLWAKVKKGRGCWLWTGGKIRTGYGQIGLLGKVVLVHRLSWVIHTNEPIPPGMCVLHKCDQPGCVRPSHLFLGTHTDNMRDAVAKKRHKNSAKIRCKRGHPFDAVNTYVTPTGKRNCKICKAAEKAGRTWK